MNQLNDFLENLVNDREPMITIDDGISGLQVAVAATHSMKENKIVKVKDY